MRGGEWWSEGRMVEGGEQCWRRDGKKGSRNGRGEREGGNELKMTLQREQGWKG